MSSLFRLLSSNRDRLVWGGLLFGWSLLLCQIPLLNLLSFEFAFACCLPISFLGAYYGLSAWGSSPYQQWYVAIKKAIGLALIPLIPITLNGLRIRNCNWIDGFLFYAILPLVSLTIATGYGVIIQYFMLRKCSKEINKFKAFGYFTGLFFITVLWGLIGFFITPAVDVFSTFMGYYPGAIYDEALVIGLRLTISRLEDLSLVALCIAIISHLHVKRLLGVLVLTYLIGWGVDIHRPNIWVQYRLGASKLSPHFQIYYPQTWSDERLSTLIKELEFNYEELSSFFNLRPQNRIQVYFYHGPQHKKRLMGAGQTLIAKPWQRSIHVHAPYLGDRVITHELAHVFSADIAPAPHHLSMRYGVLPHMSLIEGLAVAATWTRGRGNNIFSRLSPHQWTAAMRRLNIAPSMNELLQPTTFYGYNSSLSYTMCGSFVRFYRDEAGQRSLNQLYAHGGHVKGLNSMIIRWEMWLDQIPIPDRVLSTAKSLLSAPSIFYKVCAHELATRRQTALHLEAQGDFETALQVWRSIAKDAPGDQGALLREIQLLHFQKKDQQALNLAQDQLSNAHTQVHSTLSHLTQLRLQEWIIDLHEYLNRSGASSFHSVHKTYQSLIDQSVNRSTWRRLAIKRYGHQSDIDPELKTFILDQVFVPHHSIDIYKNQLVKALEKWPKSAELHYLLARQSFNQEAYQESEQHLKIALEYGLSHHSLTYESLRLLAMSSFYAGHYLEASHRFQKILDRLDLALLDGEIYELKLWKRRSLFFNQDS